MAYQHTWTIDGRSFARRSWSGGIGLTNQARPAHLSQDLYPAFRRVRGDLYREQWRDYVDYWGDAPTADTRAIFWNRAGHDAFSTVRGGQA